MPRCVLRSISPLLRAQSLVLKLLHADLHCSAIKTVCTHGWLYFVQDAAQPAARITGVFTGSKHALPTASQRKSRPTACAMYLSVLCQGKVGGHFAGIRYLIKETREEGAVKHILLLSGSPSWITKRGSAFQSVLGPRLDVHLMTTHIPSQTSQELAR